MIKRKDQIILISYSVFLAVLIIICAYLLTTLYISNNFSKTIAQDNLIIEYPPHIKTTLAPLSDSAGLKSKAYKVNVTNLSDYKVKYAIILSPMINNANNIRVSLDDLLIRNLNNFSEEDNTYVIYTTMVDPGYTDMHFLRFWGYQTSNELAINFKLSVKKISEESK